MFDFLVKNLGTIVVSAALLTVVALIINSMIKNKKSGKSCASCGSGCTGCPHSSACSK
jgi:RNase adaptor protein for sRNA GlmZ degradation